MAFNNLVVHFVWSTKERRRQISDSFADDLYAYIGGVLRKRQHVLLKAGGIEDHLHLLVGMHQSQSVADCVRDVKSNSSRWIHERFSQLQSFQWQTKYGAFSVSESNVPTVSAYIRDQKEHHKTISFQDEFLALLRRHGIKFDERFVFE